MTPAEVLTDALTRTAEGVEALLDGLSDDDLTHRPGPDANSIAWLVWHLARVQDDHVADVAGLEQVYTAQGYADRFGFPLDRGDIGYGHSSDAVAQVHAPADLLLDYVRAVHAQTVGWLEGVSEADLDRVVDDRWDPPVTLGVRLVSVVNDDAQHLGQAAYVKGLLGH
jgi:uncharacterized damage-inducible protein DinB